MKKGARIVGDSLTAAAYGEGPNPYAPPPSDAPTLLFMASSNGAHVCLEFGCAVRWITIEPPEAMRLAHLLVEHACAARGLGWTGDAE